MDNKKSIKEKTIAFLGSPVTNLIFTFILNITIVPLLNYYVGQKLKDANVSITNTNKTLTMIDLSSIYWMQFFQVLLLGLLTFSFCRWWVHKKLTKINKELLSIKSKYDNEFNSIKSTNQLVFMSSSADIVLLKSIINEFYETDDEKSNRLIVRLFNDSVNINLLRHIGFNVNLLQAYEAYIKTIEVQNIIDKNPSIEAKIFGIKTELPKDENDNTKE